MPKENNFNPIEKKIMRLLYQTKVPLTPYEVAKETGMSYTTANKYLKELLKKKLIVEVKKHG